MKGCRHEEIFISICEIVSKIMFLKLWKSYRASFVFVCVKLFSAAVIKCLCIVKSVV